MQTIFRTWNSRPPGKCASQMAGAIERAQKNLTNCISVQMRCTCLSVRVESYHFISAALQRRADTAIATRRFDHYRIAHTHTNEFKSINSLEYSARRASSAIGNVRKRHHRNSTRHFHAQDKIRIIFTQRKLNNNADRCQTESLAIHFKLLRMTWQHDIYLCRSLRLLSSGDCKGPCM